jgi:hypothetical protein
MAAPVTLPKTHLEGDMPRIAILTGGLDPVECAFRGMGIADSEFTNPGGGGYINFYTALDSDPHGVGVQGHGTFINAQTPTQATLFGSNGGTPVINQYDVVILECEGYPQTESASDLAALGAYTAAGGRVLGSDFNVSWFTSNPAFSSAAKWTTPQNFGVTATNVVIDLTSSKGMAFDSWLENVGVSMAGSDQIASIFPAFENTVGVLPPTQEWLNYQSVGIAPLTFSFNTPLGAPTGSHCGRVTFADWHALQPNFGMPPNTTAFPGECPSPTLTPQQTILEFFLMDLGACVAP